MFIAQGSKLCTVLVGLAVMMASVSYAAVDKSKSGYYSYSTSDFGSVGGFFDGISTNGGTDTIFEVGGRNNGGIELGCEGLDISGFFDQTFNFDADALIENVKNTAKAEVSKYLLTQMFSSPQLAALFDSTQAFGNIRWDGFRSSCDINEVRAEAREVYIDYCKQKGMTEVQCRMNYDEKSKGLFEEAANKFDALKVAYSLVNEVLVDTSFCGSGTSGTASSCGLASMLIPQMRICYSGSNASECENVNVGGAAVGEQVVQYPLLLTAFQHQIETISQGTSALLDEAERQGITASQRRITADKTEQDQRSPIASGGPLASLGKTQLFDLNRNNKMFAQSGSGAEASVVSDFKTHLQCSQDAPLYMLEAYAKNLEDMWGMTGGTALVNEIKSKIEAEKDLIVGLNSLGSGSTRMAVDADQVDALLNTGIGCIMNHHFAMDMKFMDELRALEGNQRDAFHAAAAREAAVAGIEQLLRFLRERLLDTYAELAVKTNLKPFYSGGTGSCDGDLLSPSEIRDLPDGYAPCDEEWPMEDINDNMMQAVSWLSDNLENKIRAIQELTQRRKNFGELARIAREKIESNRLRELGLDNGRFNR